MGGKVFKFLTNPVLLFTIAEVGFSARLLLVEIEETSSFIGGWWQQERVEFGARTGK